MDGNKKDSSYQKIKEKNKCLKNDQNWSFFYIISKGYPLLYVYFMHQICYYVILYNIMFLEEHILLNL